MNYKKLIKFISCFIPSKNLRHKFRKSYDRRVLEKQINSLKYGEGKRKLEVIEKEFPKILTVEETLNMILNKNVSITRFGDGEFNLLSENIKAQNIFQNKSDKLKKRLIEILNSQFENILVCVSPLRDKGYNKVFSEKEPMFLERYWLYKWNELKKYFIKDKIYGNLLLSRVDIFYECKLEKIKKIWEDRKVVFVYSKKGRFEIDNRLFNNIKEYEEIFIPALNAFDKYEEILEKCCKKNKEYLFLIAAGPTATVLAYDLALKGYQAIDIGHFPNCYKEYLGEILSPEILPKEKNGDE
ncbi:GT-D fold domain-containing glycosyltransferase [Fusobacterium sp.]|uniref:GT-D fold domain-containing glycosyltransferase n=1 Tax=Fusobacterium sp. TaxID=68766 RepID=UPI001DCF7490|nr:GT-D fold domain-containing glycosyltransferase [Fusobacterium sp.]MBS5790283.1 DUF1792 domain-containing protein [Fusobacterium sp.]